MNAGKVCIIQQAHDAADNTASKYGEDVFHHVGRGRFARWRTTKFYQSGDATGLSGDFRINVGVTICHVRRGYDLYADRLLLLADPAHWQVTKLSGNRFCRSILDADTDPLAVVIPAWCDRAYIMGFAASGYGTATLSITGGTLLRETLNWSSVGGDFPTSMWERTDRTIKVASGCAGQTLTITPNGDGRVAIMAVLLLGTADAQPDDQYAVAGWDGLPDPDTERHVGLDPGTSSQAAFAPIRIIDGTARSAWFGVDHFTADVTLINPVETRQHVTDATPADWAPDANTRVVQVADSYVVSFTGDGSWYTTDVCDYAHTMTFDSTGLTIAWSTTWNAAAEAAGLTIDASDNSGGYAAQWGLAQSFGTVRAKPLAPDWQAIAAWDGTFYVAVAGTEVEALSPTTARAIARLTADPPYNEGVSVGALSANGGYPKMYCPITDGETDVPLTDALVVGATMLRAVRPVGRRRTVMLETL